MDDKLPTITHYTILLHTACNRFNISVNEARTRYGLYTIFQWDKLLN